MITLRMLAFVQCLMMAVKNDCMAGFDLYEFALRLERLEAYLIKRCNREESAC